jgi:energy-coupling factor transport system permease protein
MYIFLYIKEIAMAFYKDITLGQYYPCDSAVHRLDPRTKLIALIALMTSLLMSFSLVILGVYALGIILIVYISKIPYRYVFRNLIPFFWLFLITMLVHLFWTPGKVLLDIPFIGVQITKDGISLGIVYSTRLALLIMYAALLSLTTLPIELTDALENLMAPLKKVKVPAHEMALMLSLSLRFIPTLMEEAERLKNAQLSRGARFDGNIIERIRNIIPLILPLFVSAFRRADELALAMDARCYAGGEGRTSFKRLKYEKLDYGFLMFSVLILAITIIY